MSNFKDNLDVIIKVACCVAAVVIVLKFGFSSVGTMFSGTGAVISDIQKAVQKEGIRDFDFSDLENTTMEQLEDGIVLSSKDFIYTTLTWIATDFNLNLITTNQLKAVLTDDEKSAVSSLAVKYALSSSEAKSVLSTFSSKDVRLKYFGLSDYTVMYNMIKNHKSELK